MFVADNGGKFVNSILTSMFESLGITIKTMAAESLWSNSLLKIHNIILADISLRGNKVCLGIACCLVC